MKYKKVRKLLRAAQNNTYRVQKAYRNNDVECVNKDDCAVDNKLTVAQDMLDRACRDMGSERIAKARMKDRN